MEAARKYRDRRSQVSLADATDAASMALALGEALGAERAAMAAQVADSDPYGIGKLDGIDLMPSDVRLIATFGGWTLRSITDAEGITHFDAFRSDGPAITLGYGNVIDLVSDLRSGHYG